MIFEALVPSVPICSPFFGGRSFFNVTLAVGGSNNGATLLGDILEARASNWRKDSRGPSRRVADCGPGTIDLPHYGAFRIFPARRTHRCTRCAIAHSAVVQRAEESTSLTRASEPELDLVEADFYRIGYIRHVRAYGVEFREGPDGIGVYSAKDVPTLQRPRIIMEIPLELMVTVRKELPWMFHPDIVPMGHPVFDIINATEPETDWDIRLGCLLLLALDQQDNFWQLYGDYLPRADEISSMLLATEDELQELQDAELEQYFKFQQKRAEATWKRFWPEDAVLKLKRLAREPARFLWALGIAMSRSFTMTITLGANKQDANMFIPYVDMMNHSFEPNCSYRWRRKDRMLEVVINAGESVRQGDEMTLNYLGSKPNSDYMKRYGFSSPQNPWDSLHFSGKWKIHLDSFLSSFNICGLSDEYYHRVKEGVQPDGFVDGAVIAAARILPSWSDGDLPFLPSLERQAVKGLLRECQEMLDSFATTMEDDVKIFEREAAGKSVRWKAAVRHRMDRKAFIRKVMQALNIYVHRILY